MAKTEIQFAAIDETIELKPKDCWHKEPIDSRFPNAGSHICGFKTHSSALAHKCLSCGQSF